MKAVVQLLPSIRNIYTIKIVEHPDCNRFSVGIVGRKLHLIVAVVAKLDMRLIMEDSLLLYKINLKNYFSIWLLNN